MNDMPTLGRPPKRVLRRSVILLLMVVCVLLAVVGARRHHDAAVVPVPPVVADASVPEVAARPPSDELGRAGLRKVKVDLSGPLETALVQGLGSELGQRLTQTVVRQLAWWVQVPKDLLRGDRIELLFEERVGQEPLVVALRFRSHKLGREFKSFRFVAPGAQFGHYYQPGGSELELRLIDSPLDDYDQVTSLLKDGRDHKGIDFKTPVGTPIRAPFEAVVVRKTWLFAQNGNSLELRDVATHRAAIFLHLSPLPASLFVGAAIKRGDVVAQTGNSGHSFAPHLHYQLVSPKGEALDPFVIHKTMRRKLSPTDLALFNAEMQRLEHLF